LYSGAPDSSNESRDAGVRSECNPLDRTTHTDRDRVCPADSLKEMPSKVQLREAKLVAINGGVDWVITNSRDELLSAQDAQNANDVR